MNNIEKSRFRRGEYVGYSNGSVWRITRSNSSYGNWCATISHGDHFDKYRYEPIFAFRLRDLSEKLAVLGAQS